ncbi:MAG: dTMP kinase [Gammaproteobacteria bacterium]
MKAKFITLEGGEGAGKSTNLAYIKRFLEEKGRRTVVTREPGGTVLAEKIRSLLLDAHEEIYSDKTELLLMFAARAQHLNNVILPALSRGQWVICDRFTDATYAYQGGGRGLNYSVIEQLENLVQGDFRPDLTLLLDMPVEKGILRAMARGDPDRFEVEKLDFFHRVRTAYLKQAERFPRRIKIVNADQPLGGVQRDIASILYTLVD